MADCPTCGPVDFPNIFVDGQLHPPDANNNIDLPGVDAAEFQPEAGNGINIDGSTIEACLDPGDDNALQYRNGCLHVPAASSSPDFQPTNATQTAGGIRYISAGTQGHDGTFNVRVSEDSDISSPGYGADGGLLLDRPDELQWQGNRGENITIQPGDNPGGSTGNGHRPTISVREGAALCEPLQFRCTENANGEFQVEIFNPNTGGAVPLGGFF